MRFTIRDVLWLITLVTALIVWGIDRVAMMREAVEYRNQNRELIKTVETQQTHMMKLLLERNTRQPDPEMDDDPSLLGPFYRPLPAIPPATDNRP
jgi:hypothetical protein